jgi:hypothetical protein
MAVAFVGCGSSKAPGQPPAATPTPTETPTLAPTEAPTPTAESTPTAEAGSSATPTSKAKATATPTAAPSATPTPSGSAEPTFSAAAAGCTGTAKHKAFFDSAAADLSFDVYCGAFPSDWWLGTGQYSGSQLTVDYTNNKGWTVSLGEGNFCPGLPACWKTTSSLGSASFGSLSGSLKLISAGTYGVFVGAGTTHGYQMIGKGMTQAQFKAWAAALIKIPKA